MRFKMIHENYNVTDLEKSLAFYQKALGLFREAEENGRGRLLRYRLRRQRRFRISS